MINDKGCSTQLLRLVLFCFLLVFILCFHSCLLMITINNENRMMCAEGNSEKNSEFQTGFEPTTFRTLVTTITKMHYNNNNNNNSNNNNNNNN